MESVATKPIPPEDVEVIQEMHDVLPTCSPQVRLDFLVRVYNLGRAQGRLEGLDLVLVA